MNSPVRNMVSVAILTGRCILLLQLSAARRPVLQSDNRAAFPGQPLRNPLY